MKPGTDEGMDRREFFGRVFGAGGAGLALLFIAGCGGMEEDDDEEEDDD